MNIHYLKKFAELDAKCRQFIFHYFIRAISAGIAFFIGIYLSHIQTKWLVIGYEVTALSAGYLIGGWLAAQLTDKLNPLVCSGVSILIQGICFIVIAFSTHPILLGFAVFCYGIAGYFYIAVSNYVITSYATRFDNRMYAISYFSIASNLGLLLGGVLISYLTKEYASIVFTMVGLTLIGSSWFYFSQRHEAIVIQKNNHTDSTYSNPLVYFTALLITFLLGCIIAQQRIGYQIFLNDHFSSGQISSILTLNTFLIVLFLPYITERFINYSKLPTLGLGGLLLGIGMFLAIYSNNYYFILALCVMRTIGEMIVSVLSQYLCFQFSSKQSRGKAMGNYKFIFALGILGGSFVGSNVLSSLGINAIWYLCGILGAIILGTSLLVTFYLKKFRDESFVVLNNI